MKYKIITKILLILSLSLISANSFALTDSFNVINFKPAIDNSKYHTTYDAKTLRKKSFHFGFFTDYSYTPLKMDLSRGRTQKLLEHLIVTDLYTTYGITNWWQVGINVPIVVIDKYTEPISRSTKYRQSISDVRVETKFQLLNPDKYHFGIAILPFATIPNYWGDVYVSNGNFAGGALLALESTPTNKLSISLNTGYLTRKHFTDAFGADIDDQIIYSLGIAAGPFYRLVPVLEVVGAADATDFGNIFQNELQSPLEVRAGINLELPYGMKLKAGAGRGLRSGFGDPEFRAYVGLSYNHKLKIKEKHIVTRDFKTLDITKLQEFFSNVKIYFRLNSYDVNPIYHSRLAEIARVIIKHPNIKIEVQGHTCSQGSTYKNKMLSMLRAIAIENYLIDHGVPYNQLTYKGFGASVPIADNLTSDGRLKNRRVEFKIITP